MANAVSRTFGILFIILGTLILLAGLGGAGYGYLDENENQEQLLADPERSDVNESLMAYGAVAGGVGFVLLIVGIVLAVAGGPAPGTAPAPAAATDAAPQQTTPTRRGAWIGGAVALALVMAIVVVAVGGGNGGGLAALSGDPAREGLLDEVSFAGSVRNAYSTPVQSGTTDNAGSTREFAAPAGTQRVEVEMSWTPQTTGASELRIILEIRDGDGWPELGRAGGEGPLSLALSDEALDGATLRYRVFPDAAASLVAEQEFTVQVRFHGAR